MDPPGSRTASRDFDRSNPSSQGALRSRSALWWVFVLGTILAMALPTGVLPVAGGAAPTAGWAVAPAPALHHASSLPKGVPAGAEALPGMYGPPGPVVPASELVKLGEALKPAASPPSSSAISNSGAASLASTTPDRPASAAAPSARGSGASGVETKPLGTVYQVPIGYFTGYVNDTVDRKGIAGISVAVFSDALCSSSRCPSTQTNSTGYFDVVCPAAGGPGSEDWIEFQENNWYFDNVSYDTCVANKTTWVGTTYMVRDGVGIGFVKDAVTGNAIVGVQLYAVSRDGSVTTYPEGSTGINGSFVLALPPIPAKIYVAPPAGYEATFNFSNATPGTGSRSIPGPGVQWGGGVKLGTFYLVHQTLVKAELYSSVTGKPITGSPPSALTSCDSYYSSCNTQGQGVYYSSSVSDFADPGWSYFEAFASGYVETATKSVLIPEEKPGTTYNIGPIYMVPLGTFKLQDALNLPAGGSSPWAAPTWPSIYTTICSNDGFLTSVQVLALNGQFNMTDDQCTSAGCWAISSGAVTLSAPPLRSFVQVLPDTTGFCGDGIPQWPVPSNLPPVWTNFTYVNLTAGHSLAAPDPVWVNFTIGDYIAGKVLENGTAPTQPFLVTSTSTDNTYWGTMEAFNWNSLDDPDYSACSKVQAQGAGSFCLAVAPGNSYVTVAANGYATNWTWVHVPDYCCKVGSGPGWPTNLTEATINQQSTIGLYVNATPDLGNVYGYVIIAGTTSAPIPIETVEVCPAATQSSAGCGTGLGISGSFYDIAGPPGPDYVQVSAPGYSAQRVWINVTGGGNVSAGVIPLYPLATLTGKVVGPNGTPIYLADVHYCNLQSAASCENQSGGTTLGSGLTTSDGTYNGTVPGGWLPWATYIVSIVAPGYTTDWAYANATPGNVSVLPTIMLDPIGTNTSLAPSARAERPTGSSGGGPPSAAGVWISGRVWANGTGGVAIPGGSSLELCPLFSLACGGIPDGANAEGFFNGSVGPGLYYLNISQVGYAPVSVFVNASQAGYLNLGTIYLTSDWWVAGRLVISPWTDITLSDNASSVYGFGYGPVASVEGCNLGQTACIEALPSATNGSFNVPIPVSSSATVEATATGTNEGAGPGAGFVQNKTEVYNLTTSNTTLSGTSAYLAMPILGVVTGRIWDNNSVNDSTNQSVAAYGLMFCQFSVIASGNFTGTSSYWADSGGFYFGFVPGGNAKNRTTVLAYSLVPSYPSVTQIIEAPVAPGAPASVAKPIFLERFGWIQAHFIANGTKTAVPYAAATAVYTNVTTGGGYSTDGTANAGGYLNMTAPFGKNIVVTVSAPDYNSTNFTVKRVNSSETTYANRSSTNGSTNIGFALDQWGWLITDTLNYSSGAAPPLNSTPTPVVRDWVNGLGVPNAEVTISSPDPTIPVGGSAGDTNWLGQFYADAPIGPSDQVTVSAIGYLTNDTHRIVRSGSYTIMSEVNLTGMTVVAGEVTSIPGNRPVFGATVQACGTVGGQQSCVSGLTNESGDYWLLTPPGSLSVTIAQTNYVSAASFVTGCSDCYVWAGNTTLSSYGMVSGMVRGLPSGFPVAGANASLCSPLGTPTGTCGPGVTTGQYGQFVVSAPPGSYILAVNDTNYNSTYLPVALGAGESTSVGTIFLSQFGTAEGTVYNGATYTPLAGATVIACALFGEGSCAPTASTDAEGRYSFSAAPGPYQVTVSLSGFQTANTTAEVSAGSLSSVPSVLLYSIGTNTYVVLQGEVTDNATGLPLGGVTVSGLLINGTGAVVSIPGSAVTLPNGSYTLLLPYGTYEIQAALTGYETAVVKSFEAFVSGPGPDFHLAVQTFEVTGAIEDGLTGQPVAGATISTYNVSGASIGSKLATSDLSGAFSFWLSNGTGYSLVAWMSGANPSGYANDIFTVDVNGRAVTHNLTMTPAVVTLELSVVDALTGLPLSGATVAVSGTLETVIHQSRSYTTGAAGGVAAPLYVGQYTATVTLAGYVPGQVTFALTALGHSNVTVQLSPVPGSTSGSSSAVTGMEALEIAGALGAVLVLLVAAVALAGRPKRRKPEPGAAGTGSGSG